MRHHSTWKCGDQEKEGSIIVASLAEERGDYATKILSPHNITQTHLRHTSVEPVCDGPNT